MKFSSASALLALFGSLSAAVGAEAANAAQGQPQKPAQAAAGQTPPQLKLSKAATPAIVALQQAVNANDTANLPARIAAAQAAAQNSDDRIAIGQLQLKAALAANDLTAISAAVDTIANSQYLDSAKVAGLYKDLGIRQFNAKHYDLAIVAFQKASAALPGDSEATELLGQGMLAAGRPGEAAAVLQRSIQERSAAGQKASEDIYRKAVQAALDAKSPTVNDAARAWLLAYPSADSWRNTLAIYRTSSNADDESTFAMLRLMRAAGAMTNAKDYRAYLTVLLDQSNFNEAHAVLDEAIAAKVIDPSSAENSAIVAAVRAKPLASAADLAAAAKTVQSGMALLRIGDRFYGLGQYAEAASLYRQAQAKGLDSGTVNLHIGMALAKSGDKAGAKAAFSAVTGPRAGIAKYWLLYLQQQG